MGYEWALQFPLWKKDFHFQRWPHLCGQLVLLFRADLLYTPRKSIFLIHSNEALLTPWVPRRNANIHSVGQNSDNMMHWWGKWSPWSRSLPSGTLRPSLYSCWWLTDSHENPKQIKLRILLTRVLWGMEIRALLLQMETLGGCKSSGNFISRRGTQPQGYGFLKSTLWLHLSHLMPFAPSFFGGSSHRKVASQQKCLIANILAKSSKMDEQGTVRNQGFGELYTCKHTHVSELL